MSYNPFKMWGSYVGLVLGFTALPTFFSSQIDSALEAFVPLFMIGLWVGGFLVGWGIHSFFRRVSK